MAKSEKYVRSPISRVGGKYGLAKKLIENFPESFTTYVEPFGGAAHVLFRKAPSLAEIYNDIDAALVTFFRVCADEVKMTELCRRLELCLYSRDEFNRCKVRKDTGSDIDRAYCFAVLSRQSFGGAMETWGYDIRRSQTSQAFASFPERIRAAHQRLKLVQIECLPFDDILRRYDTPDTFFYCDPPYPFTGDRGKRICYESEMTDDDHRRLVDILLHIQGKVMLSGYDTPLYLPLENAGWRRLCVGDKAITINKRKNGKSRIRKREYVWINYN